MVKISERGDFVKPHAESFRRGPTKKAGSGGCVTAGADLLALLKPAIRLDHATKDL
jgi:hypothetical protein